MEDQEILLLLVHLKEIMVETGCKAPLDKWRCLEVVEAAAAGNSGPGQNQGAGGGGAGSFATASITAAGTSRTYVWMQDHILVVGGGGVPYNPSAAGSRWSLEVVVMEPMVPTMQELLEQLILVVELVVVRTDGGSHGAVGGEAGGSGIV